MVFDFFAKGGVVMWPLLGLSILGVSLTIERSLFWLRLGKRQNQLAREVLRLYRHDPLATFKKLELNADLPTARIFLAALTLEDATPEEFRLALETAAQSELRVMKRFSNVFETIIGLAPLLGLLGTILGLIRSFASLKVGDVEGSKSITVTGGISEALIATASGLVVAIFTLLFASTFQGLYQQQKELIQEYGGHLELLYRRHQERGASITH